MRTREQIEQDIDQPRDDAILEVLLDIRDLIKSKEVIKTENAN